MKPINYDAINDATVAAGGSISIIDVRCLLAALSLGPRNDILCAVTTASASYCMQHVYTDIHCHDRSIFTENKHYLRGLETTIVWGCQR